MNETKTNYVERRSVDQRDELHPVFVREHVQRRRGKADKIIEVLHPARWQKARGR